MNANTLGNSFKRLSVSALGAMGLLSLATAPAMGQVSAVDVPYVVVVEEDSAPLRCGADELYYEVGKLKQGTMLLVDASDSFGVDGDGWLRVSFPAEQPALIKALPEQLDVDTMRGTLTLLRPSRLIAMSIDGDLSQSWKKLLAKPMEPGSTFRILETIRDENGEPLAYSVPAPESARGFIHGRFVRKATSSEAMAFRAGRNAAEPTTTLATAPPKQETIKSTPAPEPVAQQASKPAPAANPVTTQPESQPVATLAQNETAQKPAGDVGALLGVGADKAATTDAAGEQPALKQAHAAPPVFPPSVYQNQDQSDPNSTLAGADEEDDFEAYDPSSITRDTSTEAPAEAAAPSIENRPLPTMGNLETAYSAVLAQKAGMAELDPLIGEHERYLTAMDKGEAPGDDLDREVLVAHLELLKIRADLQRSMLRIGDVREQAKKNIKSIDEGIAGMDRSSEYVVVGRLTTSVVYDGKRLPLLYRVQSIDDNSGRTLAYVVPAKGVDCAGSLGTIVGVSGSARIDASSRLNIVTPTRIDRLRAGATAAVNESGRSN